MELKLAQEIGARLVDAVKPAVSRVEIAGSVRREKVNVKDLELVSIVQDYDLLFKRLAIHGRFIKPGVPGIIDWPPKVGSRYIRMLLNEGIKLDLFVASRVNWGGIFCMRTGSGVGEDGSPFSGFIPAMFSRWKKVSNGGKMSGGQPMRPDGTLLDLREEEEFFSLTKTEWITPSLRINNKAIRPL